MKKSILVGLVALFCSGAVLAAPAAVFVTQNLQVEPMEARAFATVCAEQYAEVSQLPVVSEERAADAIAQTHDPAAAAQRLSAGEYLALEFVRLTDQGKSSRVIVTAIRADANGNILHRGEVELESLSEAPEACQRIARAAVSRVAISQTRDHTNVLLAESHHSGSPTRMRTEKTGGVMTGLALPVGMGTYQPMGSVSGLGFFEENRHFYEVGVGILVPANVSGATTSVGYGGLISELGGNYYLTEGDTAPFVGGGIMPRIIFSGSVFNLAPYVQAGLMVNRQSTNRIFVEARVAQNLLPVVDSSAGVGTLPTELTLNVGMTFF